MLKICDDFAIDYDLKFNAEKSAAMRICARHNVICEPLKLAGKDLQFVQSLNILGFSWFLQNTSSAQSIALKLKSTGSLTAYTLGVRLHIQNLWL